MEKKSRKKIPIKVLSQTDFKRFMKNNQPTTAKKVRKINKAGEIMSP